MWPFSRLGGRWSQQNLHGKIIWSFSHSGQSWHSMWKCVALKNSANSDFMLMMLCHMCLIIHEIMVGGILVLSLPPCQVVPWHGFCSVVQYCRNTCMSLDLPSIVVWVEHPVQLEKKLYKIYVISPVPSMRGNFHSSRLSSVFFCT